MEAAPRTGPAQGLEARHSQSHSSCPGTGSHAEGGWLGAGRESVARSSVGASAQGFGLPALGPGVAALRAPGSRLPASQPCLPETNMKPKELQWVDRSHPQGPGLPQRGPPWRQVCFLRNACGRTLKIFLLSFIHLQG